MKSIRRVLCVALMMILSLPLLPAVPASAAYGVLFIPESVYDLELPFPGGVGVDELDFDPFLANMDGFRSWVHWDTATILTECGGLMDLTYVCAVESEYPEGNYIVRCVAFYRNDTNKTLVSYHITYQTDETEFYVISYFGHRYREAMLAMSQASLTKKEKEKAEEEEITTAEAIQQKVEDLFTGHYDGTDARIPDSKYKRVVIYKQNTTTKAYEEIKHDPENPDVLPADLTDPNVKKFYKTASYFTPSPDTIYAGVYMNGDILLRNGSGKYLGTASWFEWDYDSGKVTMSNLPNLRRLYSFPSPRVRLRAEALDIGEDVAEEDFMDVVPDFTPEEGALDIVDDGSGINYTNLVFFQSRWVEQYMNNYASAADITADPEGRALLAALMTVEFTEQQPDVEIDTSKPIFVALMDDMAIVVFDTDQGYAQLFLQLDPLATCYGYIETHNAGAVQVDLEGSSEQVWELSEDEYYDALIDLATQLAE